MKYKSISTFLSIATFTLLIPLAACGTDNGTPRQQPTWFNLTEQQMCSVVTNPNLDEVLVQYEGFTVSFNPTMHMPNWVAWTITADKIENADIPRSGTFNPDPNVPGCATLADYYQSGFDRGHMAPAADMKWNAKAMDNSFFLTNICPQSNDLNTGAWKNLEEKCRKNAMRDSLLVVVCGPVLTQGFQQYIGETPLPVPPSFFKVILTPAGMAGPQAIGFIMNNGYVQGGMQPAATTVDEVEQLTGHDFFHLLPDDIENALEADKDFNRFSTGKLSKRSLIINKQ